MKNKRDYRTTIIDGFATHQRLLTKYALKAKYTDTIVELGTGFYSSLILNEICESKNLDYHIYYELEDWAHNIKPLVRATWHKVDNWSDIVIPECFLCFIDEEELVINRYKRIKKCLEKSRYVILHDFSTYYDRGCDMSDFIIVEVDNSYPNGSSTACLRGKL